MQKRNNKPSSIRNGVQTTNNDKDFGNTIIHQAGVLSLTAGEPDPAEAELKRGQPTFRAAQGQLRGQGCTQAGSTNDHKNGL